MDFFLKKSYFIKIIFHVLDNFFILNAQLFYLVYVIQFFMFYLNIWHVASKSRVLIIFNFKNVVNQYLFFFFEIHLKVELFFQRKIIFLSNLYFYLKVCIKKLKGYLAHYISIMLNKYFKNLYKKDMSLEHLLLYDLFWPKLRMHLLKLQACTK